jgi:hypothetical protein
LPCLVPRLDFSLLSGTHHQHTTQLACLHQLSSQNNDARLLACCLREPGARLLLQELSERRARAKSDLLG